MEALRSIQSTTKTNKNTNGLAPKTGIASDFNSVLSMGSFSSHYAELLILLLNPHEKIQRGKIFQG
jgi:hypothetical protein